MSAIGVDPANTSNCRQEVTFSVHTNTKETKEVVAPGSVSILASELHRGIPSSTACEASVVLCVIMKALELFDIMDLDSVVYDDLVLDLL